VRTAYVSLAAILLFAPPAPGKAHPQEHPQAEVKPSQPIDNPLSDPKAGTRDYSREPAVYEYIHHNLRYENNGAGTLELHGKILVQTSAGLAKAGQLVFDYNAANEQIEIRSVRIEKPDGAVVTAGPESVQDLSAPLAREAAIYTDARQKHVTVPSLSVGDAVEYDVVITSTPVLAGQFWNTVYFSADTICLDEEVSLDVPREREIKYATPPATEFTVRDEGDRRIYHWKKVPTIAKAAVNDNFRFDIKTMLEGFRPLILPHIFFSTFQSWSEVGNWYAELERDRRIPTPEIRAKADEIVRGKTGELEKAQALYNWVSANVRYVSLSFGVGRYQPHAASEVLANRYGDCKDKGTLLEAFFAAQGLRAQPVLINFATDLNEDVPSPGQFNHLITYAQVAGKNIWLDSTVGVAPFGYLLPQLRDKQALVVTSDAAPALQKTPEALYVPTIYRVDVQGEVNKDSKLDAKVTLETRGDLEVLYRLLYSTLPAAKFNALAPLPLSAALKATYAAKFTDFTVDDAADTSKPLHMQFHFVGDLLYVDTKPSSREAFLPALSEALFEKEGLLALLPGSQSKYHSSGRALPAASKLRGPKEYSLSVAITVPTVKGAESEKPNAVHFANDSAEYDSSSNWEGQTLHASWKLNLRLPEVPEAQAEEYAAFCQDVVNSLNFEPPKVAKAVNPESSHDPVLAGPVGSASKPGSTPTPTTKPVSPAAPPVGGDHVDRLPLHRQEVLDLYKQGQDQSKQQNYANAVESFTEAVKLDPEDGDAWRELGRAQMYLRNLAEAEVAFRKYLALAPDDHLAYLNMAWVLSNEKHYTEEVILLTKRLANAPKDGDANARLGAAYLALHQSELALPVLQKAVSIFPRYAYPQFNLARAYLQLHQEDSAAAEFQRAIKLDDSSAMRNSAAYALAEASTHLEIAAAWSDRAIETVGLELNQTKFPLQAATLRRVSSLASYWDTMGWIKFQQGNLEAAEKYVRAGAELADDTTILYHLGRIYEAQGRKTEAIDLYAETLALIPTTQEINDDEIEARTRLDTLLGDSSLVEERLKQSRSKLKERRSISIPNPAGLEGIAQYTVIIGPGPKVIDLEVMNPEDALAGLKDAISSATMPQSFPDETIQRIPRVANLSCPRADLPCTFTFTSAGAATRAVTAD
jgi:tetratricopeptide (TPR) repeat protein/transglutaminase-like putative cysteine protease